MERESRLKQLCYEDRGGNTHTKTREAGEEDARERSRLNTARIGQAQLDTRGHGESLPGIRPPVQHRRSARAAPGGDSSVAAPHLPSARSRAGPGALPPDRSVTPPCPCRGKLRGGYSHRPT